ncbi:alpha/beta fold hydrolase [Actinopolymorpha alba]|uniref:alpha/beta fold hydrolase n=1 Tax=Actinopolymorpha alba TaxID=533267 RepID=UPI0012F670D5|nr:alpha/beta hydrolase [Actinopolymorpha alba]
MALHGASNGTRDDPLFHHLHTVLPPAGIGVATFDRRGEGASSGVRSRGRFDLQVEDALAVLEALEVKRVGFWGLSQGAWIGPLAAVASHRVGFLVLIASTGVTPSEQMMYATAEQLRRAGYDEAVVRRALALRHMFDEWVHGRALDHGSELGLELRATREEPWRPLVFLPPGLLSEKERHLWIEEMDFDPRPVFRRVRVPTLLFYGEDDEWSPVAPSIEAWQQAGEEVQTVVIPAAGHDLRLPDGTLAPKYERTLLDWLCSGELQQTD